VQCWRNHWFNKSERILNQSELIVVDEYAT
jgi:hypothetical protein